MVLQNQPTPKVKTETEHLNPGRVRKIFGGLLQIGGIVGIFAGIANFWWHFTPWWMIIVAFAVYIVGMAMGAKLSTEITHKGSGLN